MNFKCQAPVASGVSVKVEEKKDLKIFVNSMSSTGQLKITFTPKIKPFDLSLLKKKVFVKRRLETNLSPVRRLA